MVFAEPTFRLAGLLEAARCQFSLAAGFFASSPQVYIRVAGFDYSQVIEY